jgi:hypothetical protein
MTQEQMLAAMGISQQDFTDFVTKFEQFRNSLNPAQQALLDSALPSTSQIAQSFGPNCSVEDVEALCQLAPTNKVSCFVCWMTCRPTN